MKKLFFAISVLFSTLAQAQSISKSFNGNTIEFEILKNEVDPKGLKFFEVSIKSSKDINDLLFKFVTAPYSEGVLLSGQYITETETLTVKAGVKKVVTFSYKILFQDFESSLFGIVAKWENESWAESIFSAKVFKPELRPLVVLSTTSVTSSQIIVSSNITTSNLDDVASFEVTDANGNSLMKVTETIGSTVSPVTFSKSITIDLTLYPTASTLTTTSSTGGSQKLKLKSAATSAISPTSEVRKNFISSLQDDQIITIFYYDGSSQELPWGEGKFIPNRLPTIQIDGQFGPAPIFIR